MSSALGAVADLLSLQQQDALYLLGWVLLYFVVALSRLGQSDKVARDPAAKLEWDTRVVSTIHAALMVVGSCWTFLDSREYSDQDMIFGFAPAPDFFARVFRAYLAYDFFMCAAYYHLLKDTGSLIHHTLFLTLVTYSIANSYFKFQFAWLTAGELSTPFVNFRWQLAKIGKQDSGAYLLNGVLLTLTFFAMRVVMYGLGLYHLLVPLRPVWVTSNTPAAMYLTSIGFVAGYALNLYWFSLIARGILKLIYKKTTKSSKAS